MSTSTIKLNGLLSTMTTREVDERVTAHREQNLFAATTSAAANAAKNNTTTNTTIQNPLDANHSDIFCPLALWKNIIRVLTTRTKRNRKADQNTVAINLANHKQRPAKTVADFKRRTLTILGSYDALELSRPKDSNVASRFLYGLENSRYAAMKLYLRERISKWARFVSQRSGCSSDPGSTMVSGNFKKCRISSLICHHFHCHS